MYIYIYMYARVCVYSFTTQRHGDEKSNTVIEEIEKDKVKEIDRERELRSWF